VTTIPKSPLFIPIKSPVIIPTRYSKALGVSVAELVEDEKGPGKRGPAPKLQRQLDQVTLLPQAKQKFVSELLDTVLQAQTAG